MTTELLDDCIDPRDLAFYRFEPRIDQPERYDEQTAFMDSRHAGLTVLLGGNGSGKSVCALMKVVEFLLYGAPPIQRDFPFWIISNTYQQVQDITWKEKLHNFGLLPPHVIDWSRIRWNDRKADWPYSVPLVDHKDSPGKNWLIEFKSSEQGSDTFAGSSIGGFLFTEQFHRSLLEEVIARCRVYGGYGNKLAEFCPVNPEKSIWLQDMDENNEIPDSWGLYHTNTECAVESGQFDANLFRDMFAMVPQAMRPTRMKGLWGSYEGLVFPMFNLKVHGLPDGWEIPPNCEHRRGIDWGSGPENPFACVWMCRNSVGQWFIYDEYESSEGINGWEHLRRIQDQVVWPADRWNYGTTWADPADHGWIRAASEMPQYIKECGEFVIQKADNSRDDGLNYMQWLMEPDIALAGPDGVPKPRLFVHKKCENWIREVRTHRYLLPPATTSVNSRTVRPEVLKKWDHLLDATRYVAYSEAGVRGMTPKTLAKQHNAKRFGIHLEGGGKR